MLMNGPNLEHAWTLDEHRCVCLYRGTLGSGHVTSLNLNIVERQSRTFQVPLNSTSTKWKQVVWEQNFTSIGLRESTIEKYTNENGNLELCG